VLFEENSLVNYLSGFMSADDAAATAQGIVGIPVGTISPEEGDPADLILTLIEFGDVEHFGSEVGFIFNPLPHWIFRGDYTYLSKNFFARKQDEPDDLTLNAPKNKFNLGVEYENLALGLNTGVRVRYVGSYPVISGILGRETIQSYAAVDLNAQYTLPFQPDLAVTVSVQNLFNDLHRGFIVVPQIGRLGLVRLTYSLPVN
jgi:outer membrane receptor protein involved in Fe transport